MEIQKGPFVDLNQDAVHLTFNDRNDVKVVEIKFKNISLLKHECDLGVFSDIVCEDGLFYHITLGYQEAELVDDQPIEFVSGPTKNEVTDAEWSTIETP